MFSELIIPYDYIILFISFIIIVLSFIRGFINSILSLLTWIGSVIITIYAYNSFSDFFIKQLLKINFFNNLESYLTLPIIIISIPIIFIISLFLLKRIRFFISADLDKNLIGIILDKFLGLIYGVVFSCIILSTILIVTNRYDNLKIINNWLTANSNISLKINDFNQTFFNPYTLENLEEVKND
jgi:uncharacterized membrane protein required for colicin V production